MTKIQTIAAEIIAQAKVNPNGFTVATLVAQWERNVEWLGLKVGGKAWQREVFSQARSAWIATTQKTTVAIPPSEQTLAEGGFLGGEIIPVAALMVEAEARFAEKYGVAA